MVDIHLLSQMLVVDGGDYLTLENHVKTSVHNRNFSDLAAPDLARATEPGNHDENDIRRTWLQNRREKR